MDLERLPVTVGTRRTRQTSRAMHYLILFRDPAEDRTRHSALVLKKGQIFSKTLLKVESTERL